VENSVLLAGSRVEAVAQVSGSVVREGMIADGTMQDTVV
jgi:hypothetical protein